MTSRLSRYNEIISGLAPHYTNVVVQPRGFPIFSDPLLKGQVRFARKTGADFSVINPDNELLLAEPALRHDKKLVLSAENRWIEENAIISLGPNEEFAKVSDFSKNYVQLVSAVAGNFPNSTSAYLYATPLFPVLQVKAGSTKFIVKSRYHILAGDRIALETVPNLLTSLFDIRVSKARLLDVVEDDAPFNMHYEIVLDDPTVIDLFTTSDTLYLKAQPSYLSNQVFIPQVPNHPDDIGPFLIDYVSGVMFDREPVDEQLSFTVYDKLGAAIIDDDTFPLAADKQFAITEMPIMADSIILWKVATGAMTFAKHGQETQELQAIALCDDEGRFRTTQDIIPLFAPGVEWHIPVMSSRPVTLKVQFYPNAPREFQLEAKKPVRILVGTTAEEQAPERIEIVAFDGTPDTQIAFGNWIPTKNQAFSIIYGITADVYGDAQWQATNLFQKPYFLNFAMGLKGRFDSGRAPNKVDGGMLFL